MKICTLAPFRDILTRSLYLGSLETSFLKFIIKYYFKIISYNVLMVLSKTFGIKLTTCVKHSIRFFHKYFSIQNLSKCMVIENFSPYRLSKCVKYHGNIIFYNKIRTASIISLLCNILVTLIKSKALVVKFILHLYFKIYFLLRTGFSVNSLDFIVSSETRYH